MSCYTDKAALLNQGTEYTAEGHFSSPLRKPSLINFFKKKNTQKHPENKKAPKFFIKMPSLLSSNNSKKKCGKMMEDLQTTKFFLDDRTKSILLNMDIENLLHDPARHKFITLHKSREDMPLGFAIIGGEDSNMGPIGIFVKSIDDHGLARKNGSLKILDRILSINGTSMDNLRLVEAKRIFSNLPVGPIRIEIIRKY